jgi:hypothetical protein
VLYPLWPLKTMSLSEQYEKAKALFTKIENGEDVNMSEAINEIFQAIEAVEKGSLFSRNEELDDISTANLKVCLCSLLVRVITSIYLCLRCVLFL